MVKRKQYDQAYKEQLVAEMLAGTTCGSGGATTLNNGALPVSGNISISNTSNQLFVDIDGADNNIATMADNDWHLTTNSAICNVRGGGLTLSGITTDKDGITRTAVSLGCSPANTGATGWSMGAFERD